MNSTNPIRSSQLIQTSPAQIKEAGQTATRSLHNSQQGVRGAETEEKLGQAIHTNNASKNKASEALEQKNMTTGGHITDANMSTRKRGVNVHGLSIAVLNYRQQEYRDRSDAIKGPDRQLAQKASNRVLSEKINKAVTQLSKEINQLDFSKNNVSEEFFRANLAGAKFTGEALKGVFKNASENITSQINQEFTDVVKSFGPNPTKEQLDQAMISTYKKLLSCLKDISFPAHFTQLATDINNLLEQAASEQIKNSDEITKKMIQTNLGKCKNNITSALLLRSLCSDLTLTLSKNENESFKKLLAGYTDYQSGIKMHQFSSNLISKINQSTSGKKRTAMMEAFPEFDKFLLTPENNLSGFHALNKINNDILSS
jgi:hypothetical protein